MEEKKIISIFFLSPAAADATASLEVEIDRLRGWVAELDRTVKTLREEEDHELGKRVIFIYIIFCTFWRCFCHVFVTGV